MNIDIAIIDPREYDGWDEQLLSFPEYSFFHSVGWASVLQEAYQYKPLYFTALDSHKLVAVIPLMQIKSLLTGNRGVSLPFSDYSDPLYKESRYLTEVITNLKKHGDQAHWKYLELRCENAVPELPSPSAAFYGHKLTLSPDETRLSSNLRNNTKRNIKKALREGVTVDISESPEFLEEFYRLNCITRKIHGLPPQPYPFFKKIYEHILSRKKGFIALASYQNKKIAGAMYFHIGKKALYKYGASDKRFQHLRPNNLVMWEAIKWYARHGFERLCFGRTEPDNEGLRRFKLSWGTEENEIQYFKYDFRKNAFVSDTQLVSGAHNKLFHKLPIPLSKVVGSLLYKHFG